MAQITISQALRKIKKLKGELAEYKQRTETAVVHDEKKAPAFSFKDSWEGYVATKAKLVGLEAGVAEANATTKITLDPSVPSLKGIGKDAVICSLSLIIRLLQEMRAEIALLQGLHSRVAKTEVEASVDFGWDETGEKRVKITTSTTYLCHMTQAERAEAVKKEQDAFEYLNNLLETANHKTLVEVPDGT